MNFRIHDLFRLLMREMQRCSCAPVSSVKRSLSNMTALLIIARNTGAYCLAVLVITHS